MNVERIDTFSEPDKSRDKRTRPNEKSYQKEVEKVEKVPESEFEKPKKRTGFFKTEKEDDEDISFEKGIKDKTLPSPYDIRFTKKQKNKVNITEKESPDKKNVPESTQFYNDVSLQVPKKTIHPIKEEKKEKKQIVAPTKEEKKGKEKTEEHFIPNERPVFSKHPKEEKKEPKGKIENEIIAKSDLTSIQNNLFTQAEEKISSIKESKGIQEQIMPLLEKMVGVILNSIKEGITKTEILLNSEDLKNSVFYGSTIILEKYATAPDSFNITLTGSNEAVNLFNNNIEGLSRLFNTGDFEFNIGNINAEYVLERPLFKRKKPSSETSSDTSGGMSFH